LTPEEGQLFVNFVDKNKDGFINLTEFKSVVNIGKLAKKEEKFLISELSFCKTIIELNDPHSLEEKE
jgi:hypothetical protein